MALFDKVKETLMGGATERTYRYNCRECDTRFESPETSLTRVECPECGADESRSLTRL